MRKVRVVVVAAVVGLSTFGLPSGFEPQAVAAEPRETRLGIAGILRPGRHLAQTLTLPWRANLVGVSFIGPDEEAEGVEVELRAHGAGGWSEWHHLHIDDHDGADGLERRKASTRIFTTPQWVGLADRLQVRIATDDDAATIGDVRIVAINSAGNATPVSRPVRALRAVARFLTSTAVQPAEAYPKKPAIITRARWGANEDWRSDGPGIARKLKMAFVHHTANSNSYSKSDSAALVRGIYRYHTQTRGYSDIAYNFLIDRYGQIFEGRWGGIRKAVIGAHAKGFNTGSTGVALLGTFSSVAPPKAMRNALRRLLAYKLDVHHVPAKGKVTMVSAGNDRYPAGTKVRLNRISGHRDGNSTACPGYETYRRLPAIRDAVDATGRPKIYLPRRSGTTLRPDGDGVADSFTMTARFSQTLRWRVSFTNSAGKVRRAFSGTGSSVSVTWDGTLSGGALAPTGRYRWRLEAWNSNGHPARSVTRSLYVITRHPTGTFLQDATGPYLLSGGKVWPLDAVTAAAKFPSRPAVTTGPHERSWYGEGSPWGLRTGALLEGPDATRYIWTGKELRRFVADGEAEPPIDTFAALGYDESALFAVEQAYIDALPAGAPVEDATTHPDGSIIRNSATGEMFVVEAGALRSLTELARATRFGAHEVVEATAGDLLLPAGTVYPPMSGSVLKATDGGAPYLLSGGTKRRFLNWTLFTRMGYTTAMLIAASDEDLAAVPDGPIFG